jgi:uncharacterized membrane protein YeaQ/YmgE (transglycosylase-associated protein family)
MTAILGMIVIGLLAGYVARAVIPGRQDLGVLRTFVLGLVGSFIGGFLGYLLFNKDLDDGAFQASGLFGSIIGAIITLFVFEQVKKRR